MSRRRADTGRTVRVTVPGKLMLAGEYSVLSPLGRSLAMTTSPRLTLDAQCLSQGTPGLTLDSAYWPAPRHIPYAAMQNDTAERDWYERVAIAAYQQVIPALMPPQPISIAVDRALEVSFGLGSSSALALACFSALTTLAKGAADAPLSDDVLTSCYDLVARTNRLGEPLASGYDLITQYEGGLVLATPFDDQFGRWPYRRQRVAAGQNITEQLHVWVGGKGAPTTKIVGGVLANLKLGYEPSKARPASRRTADLWPPGGDWLSFCDLSDRLVEQLHSFLQGDEDRPSLLLMTLVKMHRQHLHSVQPPEFQPLLEKLARLSGCDEDFTFKTTGAGGEDALLLIGPSDKLKKPAEVLAAHGWYRLPGQPTGQGLSVELLSGDCDTASPVHGGRSL